MTRVDALLGPLETAAAKAVEAEHAGFSGVFAGEVSADPFLSLTLAADATERIEIGTSIAVAFARSPMSLAYTAYDLQQFSRGRLILGLGSQVKAHITRRFDMPWGRPAVQMRDYVLALRQIWQAWTEQTPLNFESEHYRHTLMTPMFSPPAHDFGPPPIYVAGVGEAMTRVAGEVADGFICHGFTTDRWIREVTLPALAEGRRRAGRTMDDFIVTTVLFLATGTDEHIAEVVPAIRQQLAFYASTPAYKPVLDLHGWGDLGPELTRLSKEGRWTEMGALIDDQMLDTFAIVAPPAEVPKRVAARCAGALDRVTFLYSDPTPELIQALG